MPSAVLQDEVEALPVPAGGAAPAHAKARERARGARAEVSWLMRTTYISSELAERRAQGAPDRRVRAGTDGDNEVLADEQDAHLAHCAAVEVCPAPRHGWSLLICSKARRRARNQG